MCDNKTEVEKLGEERDKFFHQYRIKKAEADIAFHKGKLKEMEE